MYLNLRKHYLQASPYKYSFDKRAKRRCFPPPTYNSRAPSVTEIEGSPIPGEAWQEPFSNKENNILTGAQTLTLIKMDPEMTELYEIKLEDVPSAAIKDEAEASERVSYCSHTAPPRYNHKHDSFIELQCAITRMRRALASAETSGRIVPEN
ncbi:hypothetical protein B0O99DRAFT_707610 [Bisporella sp. PMI_857]|nr:hypothetical protein B0O99DRAFT_707610 [Bisporella sp. PMI_857]